MIRVLVCGGRAYERQDVVFRTLDVVAKERGGIACVIEGGANGADAAAMHWARHRGIQSEMYPANCKAFGKRAVPERNARMLSQGRPDLVVAFPGGAGTEDMVRRARAAGVEVMEVTP